MGLDGLRLHAKDTASAHRELARVRDYQKRLQDLLSRLDTDALRAKAMDTAKRVPTTMRERLAALLGRKTDAPMPRVRGYGKARREIEALLEKLGEAEGALKEFLARQGAPVQRHIARAGSPAVRREKPPGPLCKNCANPLPAGKVFCPHCGLRVI